MTEMLRIVGLCDDARRFELRQGLRNDNSATTLRIAPAARRFGIAQVAAQRRFVESNPALSHLERPREGRDDQLPLPLDAEGVPPQVAGYLNASRRERALHDHHGIMDATLALGDELLRPAAQDHRQRSMLAHNFYARTGRL